MVSPQQHSYDKHSICVSGVGKEQTCKLTLDLGLETRLASAQKCSRALTLQGLSPFLLLWGFPFLEALYTLGIFSDRSSAPCVKFPWPSSPSRLFRGHREKGRIVARVGGMSVT